MAVRWYSKSRKRYYAASVTGFRINPRSGRDPGNTQGATPSTWFVLDRDNCHLEMGVFEPRGRTSADCKTRAETLAHRLNRLEERYEREMAV